MLPLSQDNLLEKITEIASNPRVIRSVTAFLLLVLLWQIIKLAWLFSPDTAFLKHSTTGEVQSAHQTSLPVISQWHLFGNYQSSTESLPDSQLQLTLVGVFTNPTSELSRAIIATADGTQHVYAPGQSLPDNAVLLEVLPDAIIIEHEGQREKIMLPRPELLFSPLKASDIF